MISRGMEGRRLLIRPPNRIYDATRRTESRGRDVFFWMKFSSLSPTSMKYREFEFMDLHGTPPMHRMEWRWKEREREGERLFLLIERSFKQSRFKYCTPLFNYWGGGGTNGDKKVGCRNE